MDGSCGVERGWTGRGQGGAGGFTSGPAPAPEGMIPTLVIAGDADLYAPPALMRRIADRIKGAQFAVFPDAGHSVWWEAPDKFNQTVLAFVAKH